jgi:hypothetical protein
MLSLRRLLPLCLLLAALPALAGAPDTLAGTWELDLKASSDPQPVLKRMGANWLIREAAKSVRPTHIIIAGNGRFSLTIKSLIVTRRYLVVLDDSTKTDDDFFGHPFFYTSHVEGDAVVSQGVVDLGDKGSMKLSLKRFVDEQGRMRLCITLFPDGEAPLEIQRVFQRRA